LLGYESNEGNYTDAREGSYEVDYKEPILFQIVEGVEETKAE
jgi:hypothetical protein